MTTFHLGINLGHDRSAALVADGEVVVAIQQERLDRHKHSVGFLAQSGADTRHLELPLEAVNYCMDSVGIDWGDIASVVANMPGKDNSAQILQRKLPRSQHAKIRSIPSHHLAHAYTAFWPSGFDRALVLVTDASGSTDENNRTESYSIYVGNNHSIDLIHAEKVEAHLAELSTLGFIYEYIARKAGFVTKLKGGVTVPESGKLMGLAPYGKSQPNWQRWINTVEDSYSLRISAYDIFLEVAALEKRYDDGEGKPYLRPYLVDLAYKVQEELEQALLHLVRVAQKEQHFSKLCLAGGVALNSVANYLLLRETDLEDIFTYPAAGDAGIAAGCALWSYATTAAETKRPVMKRADLGKSYDREQVLDAVSRFDDTLVVEELSAQEVVQKTAQALTKGHIVARVDGRSEFGPRALGQRSILADPTFAQMRDIINARVKFREPFRPFAPVIPEERVNEVFEQNVASPFMLLIAPIRKAFQELIPSVTHHDGTGRLQTVSAAENPFFHALCYQIASYRGGPPVILNTSFNVAGQPIVETPEEAISTFLRTDIDYCCIDNFWISRKHERVLDYDEHLSLVTNMALPEGLGPMQDDVSALMQELDDALFRTKTDSVHWSVDELHALSTEGARFKETSQRFSDGWYGAQTTRFADQAVLIVNPLGQSVLHDLQEHSEPLSCDYSHALLLMAVYAADETRLSELRRHRGVTTRAWQQLCEEAREQLERFGLQVAHIRPLEKAVRAVTVPSDMTATEVKPTLYDFADENFYLQQELDQLRTVLDTAGYSEQAIKQKLNVESLQQIEPTRLHYYDRYVLGGEPLDQLIRLFLLRVTVNAEAVRELLSDSMFHTLLSLGILQHREDGVAAGVDLFVVEDLYLVTDHRFMLFEEDYIEEDPVMYIGLDSLGLSYVAPRLSCHAVLDLCTGSGVQALTASRYAESVIAVDLNPRALRFVRFNAQLNGVSNVRALQSNLYEQLDAKNSFDVILANPPFVPSPDESLRFRDGGATGESVLARIIQEAHYHLQPGGRLHIVTDLVKVSEYKEKLQAWWGGPTAQKVVFMTADRDEILFAEPHANYPFAQSYDQYNEELRRWVDNFRGSQLDKVNFGYILIHDNEKLPESSYTAKVINSPRQPIYAAVTHYLEQLSLLFDESQPLYLRLHPQLAWRIEDRFSDQDRRVQLYVENDPLFTAYRISQELLDMLQLIDRNPTNMHSISDSVLRESLFELVRKGLVWVSTRKVQGNNSACLTPNFVQSRQEKIEQHAIQEDASRTTPTCLTSYMRG